MKITRRQFLKGAAAAGVLLSVPLKFGVRSAHAFYQSPAIPLFGTPLRGVFPLDPNGIPVAIPDGTAAPVTGVTHYKINIGQFTDQLVPSSTGLGPTTLWGYNPANALGEAPPPQRHLGGIIVGQKGDPIQITFRNNLPQKNNPWGQIHPLPVDVTIPGAENRQNRVAVHLHGGLVPWISDGGPFDYFGPGGSHGDSFLNNQVLNPFADPGQAEYYYPLNQSARFMWYHDHAVGITRLNAYAGIASGMLIRDKFEGKLRNLGLPDFIENGGREIPIVIQDKIFIRDNNILVDDPTWTGARTPGSLWYDHTYPDPVSGPAGSPPDPSAVPEFFGDTMLVNGTTFPEATVEARRYRLRLLNACNARFLNLQLYVADGSPEGITLDGNGFPRNSPFVNHATGKPTWLQIGTEGGFLPLPAQIPSGVPFSVPPDTPDPDTGQVDPRVIKKSLLVAPAERPDVIIDFRDVPKKPNGTYKSVILYNDAPAPYPGGDAVTDYFPGLNNGNPANTKHFGVGPNSRIIMRFKVVPASGPADRPLFINGFTPTFLDLDPFLLPPFIHVVPPFFKKRFLTLNEWSDDRGRLVQILGNAAAPFGSPYFGTATYQGYGPRGVTKNVGATEEEVHDGDVEVWEIYNNTGDVHPMHFHLVNVQVINRQLFDVKNFAFKNFTSPIIPPDRNETGWKETVQMFPGTVTRVLMKFELPRIVGPDGKPIDLRFAGGGRFGTPPPSPRTGGAEYVWHCHILEHEEHDMMHALVVT